MKVCESVKKRIIHLFEFNKGEMSQIEIAKKVKVSTGTVSKVLTKHYSLK